jgi:hypothetical protein
MARKGFGRCRGVAAPTVAATPLRKVNENGHPLRRGVVNGRVAARPEHGTDSALLQGVTEHRREVNAMTRKEAEDRATRLGLSTWMVEAIAVGPESRTIPLMCVGFASLDMALGEAETWEEALAEAEKIAFAS